MKIQVDFDSRFIMKTFHQTAIDYITEHVEANNPIKAKGEDRSDTENQPFFLYLSFRAPHRPYSHGYEFDEGEFFKLHLFFFLVIFQVNYICTLNFIGSSWL